VQNRSLKFEYTMVLLMAGIIYGISVAPGALWQDNGMAQVRVLEHDYVGKLGLALAHPLFYLLARAFQFLPFQESAFKTNLVAAACGALTVANLYLLLNWLLAANPKRRLAAVIGTLGLMLAHTFWQHSALAEVYTVSTFILTCELLALVRYVNTPRPAWWLAVCFLNGLECSNHVLALITLAAFGIWSLFLIYGKKLPIYWIIPGLLLWIVGCLPYEYLGFQAWQAGTPLSSVIRSMLFGDFQSQVLNLRLSFGLLVTAGGVIGLNFATPNILLIPAGLLTGRKNIEFSLFNFFLLATIFHLIFAMRYPVRDQYTFFIIPVLFLAVWLAIGAAWALDRRPSKLGVILILFALIPPLIYALIPGFINRYNPKFAWPPIPYRDAATFFFHPWKTGYHGGDQLVREVFDQAKPNAVILADSTASRPFIYYQIAKAQRTDLSIVDNLYPNLPPPKKIKQLASDLKTRQVWIVRPYPDYCPPWLLDHFQIIHQKPIYLVQKPK
jgi:hypothetical protein